MLSTESHELRAEFIEALQSRSSTKRLKATKAVFKRIETEKVQWNAPMVLPLYGACQKGDPAVIDLYIRKGALINKESALAALNEGLAEAEAGLLGKPKKFKKILALTEGIEQASEEFNHTYPTTIHFLESLHLACFLLQKREATYFSKRRFKLPATVLMHKKEAYILYKRKDQRWPDCNQIGFGSYKEVYPALRISLKALEVLQAVQIVPNNHDRYFDANAMTLMAKFSDMGGGFAHLYFKTRYFSRKKRGVREIALQQYWRGGNLANYTLRTALPCGREPLPLDKQITVAAGICKGIAKMHREGLVHGDIKPKNCLYDGDGNGCVTDFDLLSVQGTPLRLWETRFFYGTPPYIAPEYLVSHYLPAGAGQPGDMYALGMTLYMLSIGTPAWYKEMISYTREAWSRIHFATKWASVQKLSHERKMSLITQMLESCDLRQWVLAQQQRVQDKLAEYRALAAPTCEQQYHWLIYRLLDPDPSTRITAEEFMKEIRRLKREAIA